MKTIALVLLCAACAGAPLEPVATSPTKLAPAPRSFDARSWVGDYVNAAECETAARRLHNDEPQPGWEALKACVEKQYPRGSFTYLNLVTGGVWGEKLPTRPRPGRRGGPRTSRRGGRGAGDPPAGPKVRAPALPPR